MPAALSSRSVSLRVTQKERKILATLLLLVVLGLLGLLLLQDPPPSADPGTSTSFSRPGYQPFSTSPA